MFTDIIFFKVSNDNLLSDRNFSSDLSETPFLIEFKNMLKVFTHLISFETVYFQNVIIMITVNTKHDNGSKVRPFSSRVSEVHCGNNIKTFFSEEPLLFSSIKIILVIVLKEILLNGRFIHTMGIIVILRPEINFIKVLGSFLSKFFLIKTKPLTVCSLGTGPEIFSSTVSRSLHRIFFNLE